MSKKRHAISDPEEALFVRTYAVTHPASVSVPTQTHDWHQLAMASRGVMSVNTTQGTWVVPPHRAVWIPAGVQHRIDMFGSVAVRSLYFATSAVKGLPTRCLAVNVSPLLRELVLHAVRVGCVVTSRPTLVLPGSSSINCKRFPRWVCNCPSRVTHERDEQQS